MEVIEIKTINIKDKLGFVNNYWTPKIIGELNGQLLKVAKFKGEFINHKHDYEDEMFLVINGTLFIKLENDTITVKSGEFVIIPKGVYHKPYSDQEVEVLLFEPDTTLNTGNIQNDFTINNLQKI